MKYTLVLFALLAFLSVVAAETEAVKEDLDNEIDDEIVDVDHFFHHDDFHKFPHKKHFVHKPRKKHIVHKPHKKHFVHKPHKKHFVHKPHKKFHGGFHKKHFVYKPHKVCLKPTLTAHLVKVLKHYHCSWYKPFGFKIIIVFKTKYHTFTYIIKICSYKHSIALPKKIFKCSLDLALKKCKFVGLPKCVTHKKYFYHRKKILGKCLIGVLKKCSKHGTVLVH